LTGSCHAGEVLLTGSCHAGEVLLIGSCHAGEVLLIGSCHAGEVKVTLTDAKGVAVPFKLVDNKDKTYRVEFQATVAGVYTATVMYAGQPATGSPYKITVESAIDLSKVQVKGLPESKSHYIPRGTFQGHVVKQS